MKKIVLFLLAATCYASTVTVTVVSTTPQQAILDISASDNTACTIQVSQSATLSPLAYDVDESRFSGSSSCNRTGAITRNNTYRMVIGKRATATETAGDIVSRSLQAFSTYFYKVTLASGATASGSFTTANPGLGNSAPDYIPFNAAGPDNYGWPSQHWSNVKVADASIDPLTGFLTTRITGPGMMNSGIGDSRVNPWIDNSGGGWSCPSLDQYPSGHYCVYTGTGGVGSAEFLKVSSSDPFLPAVAPGGVGSSLPAGLAYSLGDMAVQVTGHGDPMQACITSDGTNCLSSPVDIPFTSSDATYNVPGDFPNPPFHSWGISKLDPKNMGWITGNITISGNVVTISAGQVVLPPTAHVGMSVYMLPDYTPYKIASIQDAHHFTLAGTVPGTNDYTQYFLMEWGVMLWSKGGAGSASVEAVDVRTYHDETYTNGYDGFADGTCNSTMTLTTDANGITVAPYTAKVCRAISQHNNRMDYLWVPSTGEIRVFNESGIEPGWNYVGGYMQQCTYDNTYLGIPPGNYPVTNTHYSCTTPNTTYTILQEIQGAYGSTIDLNYWLDGTGAIPPNKFKGVYNKGSHEYALFVASRDTGSADVSYWEFVLDLSLPAGPGQVIQAHNSWSVYPTRWGLTHDTNGPGIDYASGGTSHVDVFKGLGQTDKVNQNNPIGGEYVMQPTTVYSNTGSGTSLTNTFMSSCSALGVTDARWIAEENPATGDNSCIKVNVPYEPVNLFPPTAADGSYANGALTPLSSGAFLHSRQSPWAHNASSCGGDNTTSHCWGYLQDLAEGDWLQVGTLNGAYPGNGATWYVDPSGEIDIVGKKTVLGNGTIDLVLIRGLRDLFGNITSAASQANGFYLQPMPANGTSQGTISGEYFFPLDKPFTAANVGTQNPAVDGAHQNQWGLPDGSLIYQEAVVDISFFGFPEMREMNENYSGHGIRQGLYPEILPFPFQFAQPAQYPFNASIQPGKSETANDPVFGNEQVPTGWIQQHPSKGGSDNSANTSFTGIDFGPMGGSGGGQTLLWPQSATLVSGQTQTYLVQNPQLYNPGNCNGSNDLCGFDGTGVVFFDRPDPKRRQIDYWAGGYLLQNISGPGSVVNDSKPYTACYALNAGECVSGSTAGQTFEAVPNADLEGTCIIDDMTSTPCWSTVGPNQAWGYQYDVKQSDPWGKRWRRITMGYDAPGREDNYDTLLGDSDGSQLYVNCYYCDGYRNDILAVQVPPMPGDDGEARNTFVPFKVQLSGAAGSFVRARFGYAEYARGGTDNLFCSAERGEECATNVPTGNTDPYTWLSETSGTNGWTACDSGCTVIVPFVADRIGHYVIDRNTGGAVTSTPEQVVAIH